MSNWTHVAAIARVDCLRFYGQEMDFEAIFGKTLRYEDESHLWEEAECYPDRFLPMGSEGSLNMSVWSNPDKNCLASYTVSIFGDLRDHDNPDEIINWFKNKCVDLDIRNACITVENECYGVCNWVYER